MPTVFRIALLACALFSAFILSGRVTHGVGVAAEFDVDGGRAVLRRLQYCESCGSALLVTDVRAGERIRCPDCGAEQTRLEDEFLLTQLYQICKLCSGPLNPEGHRPGDLVECEACRTRQTLVADAFAMGGKGSGLGYRPGFPPGTGKKTLLLSPNRADASITAVPLEEAEDGGEEAALSAPPPLPDGSVLAKIPEPPPGFRKEEVKKKPEAPAAPEEPAIASAAPPLPEIAPAEPPKAARAVAPQTQTVPSDAIEVPAVTADLFGGARPAAPADGSRTGYIPTGELIARVDGQSIHARDVDLVVLPVMERLRRQSAPADAEALAQREAELRREVLNRLIDRELAIREAAALGHHPDPDAVRAREAELAQMLAGGGVNLRREAERDVIMTDMRARFAERFAAVTPTEVREFYQQHKGEMMRPRLLALDQLVVYEERANRADPRPARDLAREIAAQLEQGTSFETLRQRYDEFLPAAGLAHVPPALKPEDAYSRQILAAAGDFRSGAVFGPVATSGAHIFGKITDTRPAGPTPFAEAEKTIREHLEARATEKAFAKWLSGLRANARVEIVKESR